ncbi:MAG: cbb3-type cytochrome oxidase assembly protein CcoS [Pseudomonadota bacterium]
MEVIYGLIPFMIILGLGAVGLLFWAARNGQFDDMDGEAHRILMDEDLTSGNKEQEKPKEESDQE